MKRHKKIVHIVPLGARRFKAAYVFCLLLIFGLFGRLISLQGFSASELQKKARLIQLTKTSSFNRRRSIVDRNNRLIAYDKPLYKLWAHPKYFKFAGDSNSRLRSVEEVVNKLSPTLNVKNEFLLSKFENKNIGIELLDEITENQAEKIKNLHIVTFCKLN